jgi:hypothetical protein
MNSAESSGVVRDGDYEMRFLRVASLYFDAVWLHSATGNILIPICKGITGLRSGQAYSEGDVIKILQPLALAAQDTFTVADSRDGDIK